MSEKSGVTGQVLPLPTGGGALQGIGETFRPDLFTGTGNVTVPIAVPPGRNGFQPALTLAYSTGTGNGPFGLGWQLGTPAIVRKTSRGVPRYRDETDTFLLAGVDDLVPVGAGRYRPRQEGAFARIERRPDGWLVRGRDGLTSHYGGDAVVADPQAPARVFAWHLTAVTDPFGNRIDYRYRRDGAQLYLDTVRYVDHERDGHTEFLVSVSFAYRERPDQFAERRAGFAIGTRLRCTGIEVRTHPGGEPVLSRSYRLRYVDERVAAGDLDPADLAANGASLLGRIDIVGHDGERTEQPPPLDFAYRRFTPGAAFLRRVQGALPGRSLAHPDLDLVDLDGDGLPDVVEMNGSVRWWRNLGDGAFDAPRPMPEMPAGLRLADPGTQFGDLNGNGRTDLLSLQRGGYFPLSFAGGWSAQGFVRYPTAPAVPFGDGNLRLVDLDGDGVVDALRTGQSFELFFNDPVAGWNRVETRPRRPLAEFPDVSFADPRVRLGDLTGDGLQDIMSIGQGRIDYWPYLGHGRWGRRLTMADSPVFRDRTLPPGAFDPRRVLIGDVDGDGIDDLVYVDADRVTVWINRSGQGWSEPFVITGTPAFPDIDAVRLVDLLGTGSCGLLWTADGGAEPRFLDLTAGAKPYLLSGMDNNRGARTAVTYASSVRFAVADARTAARWRTPLPFPVPVVLRSEVFDDISGTRVCTEYAYHHGYWDGAEREFRGFAMVEQRDTDQSVRPGAAPTLLTRTWFHVGPIGDETGERTEPDHRAEYWPDDPPRLRRPEDTARLLRSLPASARADALRTLRGSILRTELYALDGSPNRDRPITVTENEYGLREESPRVYFPHPRATRTTQWERGEDPMHRYTYTDGYDAYGMAGRVITVAVPRTGTADPYLAVSTETEYARRDDDSHYLVDRVARSSAYDIRNDGSGTVEDLVEAVLRDAADLRLTRRALTHYDGEAFVGLPLGEIGEFGAPMRSETLVLTEEQIREAYAGKAVPPYLVPGGEPDWTPDYPDAFRAATPALAGYVWSPEDRAFYVRSDRRRYSARGLCVASRDALDRETTIEFDPAGLLPVRVTGPTGLATEASYDYRVLKAARLTEPNGTSIAYAYTPFGLLAGIAMAERPETEFHYDMAASPASVRTVRRAGDDTLETVEYSDGMGRLVQTRARIDDVVFDGVLDAEPGERDRSPVAGWAETAGEPWMQVTGAQVYDDKGRVVERYEPYLDAGWSYRPATDAQRGNRIRMTYDAQGRLVRTRHPDGTESRTVYGVPADLRRPDEATPTPWETYVYDANDNAGRTRPADSDGYRDHWDTPSSVTLDALGRVVRRIERSRAEIVTGFTFDIDGNLRTVTDPAGRTAFRHTYDAAGRQIRLDSIDAGTRCCAYDAAGEPIERSDGRGALTLRAFDRAGRPARVWARDRDGDPVTQREALEYGETEQDRAANRLGRLVRHADEAGVLEVERYDLRGNPLERVRRVVADTGPGLAPEEYRTSLRYDALSRITSMRLPADPTGRRAELRPVYGRSGALRSVRLDGRDIVQRIACDARGQRSLVALGNGILCRYAYDPETSRLVRARVERHDAAPDATAYRPAGPVLSDVTYRYDCAGNLVSLTDRTPGGGVAAHPAAGGIADPELRALVAAGDALVRTFAYDPLYRLVAADGRAEGEPAAEPWNDRPAVADPGNAARLTHPYRETYAYDVAGNLTAIRSTTVRRLRVAVDSNRLARMSVGSRGFAYAYDANGNLIAEADSRQFTWDHQDRMTGFQVRAGDGEPSVDARYLYDAAGRRVKKVVRRQGGVTSTVYIDGVFEQHRWTENGTARANASVHVMDNSQRVAIVRFGPPAPGDTGPVVQYHHADHLGSAHLVTDDAGALVGREEFTPFGESSVGAFARKRFRFIGKERDEESGLACHGARYYAYWTGRWTSCDPLGMIDGLSLYTYAKNRPTVLADKTGMQSDETQLGAGVQVSVEFRFGSQDVSSAVNVKLFAGAAGSDGSAEAGVGYTLSHNYKKVGVGDLGEGSAAGGSEFNWNVQLALGPNSGFTGLDSGSNRPLFGQDDGWSVGLGIGQRHLNYPRKLGEFNNIIGEFRLAVAGGDTQSGATFGNDVKMFWPLLIVGGNTDGGLTTYAEAAVTRRNADSLVRGGVHFDMFTPMPADPVKGHLTLDEWAHYRKPTLNPPVRGSRHGTYDTSGDFPGLYHGNVFAFGEYRSSHLTLRAELGADSHTFGQMMQDGVHTHITNSPFFLWTGNPAVPYWSGSFSLGGGGHLR